METQPLIEKSEIEVEPPEEQPQTLFSRRRAITYAAIFMVLLFLVDYVVSTRPTSCRFGLPPQHFEMVVNKKVPFEAHIMSKCPDARDCLKELVLPTMERVVDKVDFKLSYIGKTTDEDDGVECMHGASECLGNIMQLCAASVYPDPKIYLGFTMCLSEDYQDIPARNLMKDCALEHGMDFDKLNACASDDDGAKGIEMLRKSVERSAELNVTTSCTIRVNDTVRCVRDGGKWKDCDDGSSVDSLVSDIEDLADES